MKKQGVKGRARTPNKHHQPGAGPNLSIEIWMRRRPGTSGITKEGLMDLNSPQLGQQHGHSMDVLPFNDTESSIFKRDFYCSLILNCWRSHWWVYAFEVNANRLVIIDSLHSVPQVDERDNLDAYVGRLFEDMVRIIIPAFVRTTYGPFRSYARVPKQPNNFDCGICVIKFMES
nr:uncharacterized protein LOC112717679 [Arachis hypogaea]